MLEYFTFQNIFTDRTLLEGVEPAAGRPLCDARPRPGASPSSQRTQYWDFDFREPERRRRAEEYREELDRLFRQAVTRQLVTDVELGSYLSGGMDSGSITAVAAEHLPLPQDLHLRLRPELRLGHRARASTSGRRPRRCRYRFKTEHYEMVLKAGDMERSLPRLAWHLEEPRVGQSYPNYLRRPARQSKFVKVVLSGAGGDELFGGYPWRYYRAVVNDDFEHYVDKYYGFWQRLVDNGDLKQMFAPIWSEVADVWTRDIFRDVFRHHDDALERARRTISTTRSISRRRPSSTACWWSRTSSAWRTAWRRRVPFLDNDLVDFAMRCPVQPQAQQPRRGDRGSTRTSRATSRREYFQKTKRRQADPARRDGAATSRTRSSKAEKQGFSAPDASWFKGESIDFVRDRLLDDGAPIYDCLDRGRGRAS